MTMDDSIKRWTATRKAALAIEASKAGLATTREWLAPPRASLYATPG